MFVALIHWRIKPDKKSVKAFIKHWETRNSISDTGGLIAEFMSDTRPMANFPYITWHLDPESLGNFKSYVTIGCGMTPAPSTKRWRNALMTISHF
jgi:hypothetical protein